MKKPAALFGILAGRASREPAFALQSKERLVGSLAPPKPLPHMKEAIRMQALELGFDDCRFTTAAAPASADRFQNWLSGKQHGEMTWLERTAPKRVDPQTSPARRKKHHLSRGKL